MMMISKKLSKDSTQKICLKLEIKVK